MSTKIEWVKNPDGTPGETWNPVTGCTPISDGCRNCYAKNFAKRMAGRYGYPEDEPFRVTLHPERLENPSRWRKPRRVFVGSMGDLFHDQVPEGYIDSILEIIAACPQHIFLVLTKRPQNINRKMYEPTNEVPFRELGGGDYLPNLWLGVSVENQKAANERIPILLQTPAAVRFVSAEPMLEPIYLRPYDDFSDSGHGRRWLGTSCNAARSKGIDWVVCGGETGPGARPVHPDWVRNLVLQCKDAGVPIFIKQMGSVWAKTHSSDKAGNRPEKWPEDLRIRELPPNRNCSLTP